MTRIMKVIPMDDYSLMVQLDNGSSVILNLKNKLGTIRFGIISDIELFRRAITDGSFIRWDNKLEISVNEVFQLTQSDK
jgi:hypothetical protein